MAAKEKKTASAPEAQAQEEIKAAEALSDKVTLDKETNDLIVKNVLVKRRDVQSDKGKFTTYQMSVRCDKSPSGFANVKLREDKVEAIEGLGADNAFGKGDKPNEARCNVNLGSATASRMIDIPDKDFKNADGRYTKYTQLKVTNQQIADMVDTMRHTNGIKLRGIYAANVKNAPAKFVEEQKARGHEVTDMKVRVNLSDESIKRGFEVKASVPDGKGGFKKDASGKYETQVKTIKPAGKFATINVNHEAVGDYVGADGTIYDGRNTVTIGGAGSYIIASIPVKEKGTAKDEAGNVITGQDGKPLPAYEYESVRMKCEDLMKAFNEYKAEKQANYGKDVKAPEATKEASAEFGA